ncbi:transposase [Shewanella sp. AS16]|uniref:transposase n=1 Tax=Shewanella sp. AS16 TaxID=2907625 RepID=UPI001F3C4ABF|nr:transposase [Shewanella sp. AS16]MCE9687621.1 transposase [Shewanella sp. AS16]
MPRKPRISIADVPVHVIQRGNNRQVIFANEEDMKAYLAWLKDYSKKYGVNIHAWVLMTNHVHLLCTPVNSTGISQMMQALGRMYVMYFNKRYHRSGTLWEGRFRSCLVQEDRYLFQLYRYIELNPVRAGMVADPADYSWSSYQCNGLGRNSELLSPHRLYLTLGDNEAKRQEQYRALFKSHVDVRLLDDIRKAANKGLALGNERFIDDIVALTGKRLDAGKRGRQLGWRKHPKAEH